MTTLLLASSGGHLSQLHQLHPRLVPPEEERFWVTFDSPQSRSLLDGQRVHHVPYVAPRDWRGIISGVPGAVRLLRRERVDRVLTTGSGVALTFLPTARALGIACHYVESAARSDGPSVTGRLLARVPGVRTSTQYRSWADDRWTYTASVFDDFTAGEADQGVAGLTRVVVTLGTIQNYEFPSLLGRLLEILPGSVEVLWQTGHTSAAGMDLDAVPFVEHADLAEAMRRADVVVAHAGIGSALAALHVGRCPILVPRRLSRGEHVDDHQVQIARELDGRGLALHREVEDLVLDDLLRAASTRVSSSPV